ncbi:hypothetical protein POTOM_020449 [Populus tomentosa]|uniref:C2 domain-containing protein n=1 Tax=Populus tomentosa TaxID=118781 RepID=A0A8X7ZLM9_POPTO|nr:hypothetical protein POTOM_020449 [Populus tomentosa]
MECRSLEITVISAKDLKDVTLFGQMDVYCVVSLKGDDYNSKQKQKTHVHKDSGPNPVWNFPLKFTIDDVAAQQNRLKLKFMLKAKRMLKDKDVGVVFVPVNELLGAKDGKGSLSYSVSAPRGRMKGTLNFLFKFGEKFNVTAPAMAKKMDGNVSAYPAMGYHAAAGGNEMNNPVTAYPVMGYQGAAGSSYAYPAPPPQAGGDKHQTPYPYPYNQPPPPQHGYGGYPPAPGHGYPGYPPQPMYGGGYQPGIQQKPKRSGRGNMGLGLGAGLLGGLLVGDMISDVVLQQSQLMVVFRIWRTPIFLGGNQLLGEVYFPVKLLLDNWTEDKQAKEGSCPVVTPSGKHRGCLVFKYHFGHGTIRGAPKKVGENLINPAWSSQLLPSRHHGGCLSAPKSSPYNPAYYEATRLPQAPPFGTIY